MAKYVFGVDIGGTTVKIGIFTDDGKLFDKWEIPTRTDEGGKYILSDIAESVEDRRVEMGIDKKDVLGVGMGVPGPVRADGTVLRCVNLGWGIFNVEEELSKLTGYVVKAGNDANMAALGEMWHGKMISGVNGAGGEIGHICVNDSETEKCGCGNTGCLEQYTSATGIVRSANILLNTTDKPSKLRTVQYISAKEIFDAAKDGDELAASLVENHGKVLGKALAQIACVVDPEIFVIGGGVSRAGDILVDTTKKYFLEYAFHACRTTQFALATLGNDAGIYGGACSIITK